MVESWSYPKWDMTSDVVYWSTKILDHPPQLFGQFSENPIPSSTTEIINKPNIYRPSPDEDNSLRWIVRIYMRSLKNTGENINGGLLENGGQIATYWYSATAWFAAAAHKPGERATYLMTAAHNVLDHLPRVDDNGIVVNITKRSFTPADAIFVVATCGSEVYQGWVDRVAVMKGYAAFWTPETTDRRCDGAALRIANSKIPAHFYQGIAPRIAAVPAPTLPKTTIIYNKRYVVMGFPGVLVTHPELNGIWLCGLRRDGVNGKKGMGWERYIAGTITRRIALESPGAVDPIKDYQNGVLESSHTEVPTTAGVSGGPCLMFLTDVNDRIDQGEVVVVGVHNSGGCDAPLAPSNNSDFKLVDPCLLLVQVGASNGMSWKLGMFPGNLNWQYLTR